MLYFAHAIVRSTSSMGDSAICIRKRCTSAGLVMIFVDRRVARRPLPPAEGLAEVTLPRALAIGVAQCFSLWPGMSRSMATIVGGQLSGLSTRTAADFSFLLAIPTLGAATAYKLLKSGPELLRMPGGPAALAVGMVSAFVVALAVIRLFLRFLPRFGLVPFGVYRLFLGALVLGLTLRPAPPRQVGLAPQGVDGLVLAESVPGGRAGPRLATATPSRLPRKPAEDSAKLPSP